MEKVINVKNIIGENFTCADAILLKGNFKALGDETIVLDFNGINDVPTTFFYSLFSDILYTQNRKKSFENIKIKNLVEMDNYNRVMNGTTLCS
jgi:hypothetical protein